MVTAAHNSIGKYRRLHSKLTLELALFIPSPLADRTTSRIVAELGKNVNVRSSA